MKLSPDAVCGFNRMMLSKISVLVSVGTYIPGSSIANMNRRCFISSLIISSAIIPGCLAGDQDSEQEVQLSAENPPNWLNKESKCEYPTASLQMSDQVKSVSDRVSVINYNILNDTSKVIVAFAIKNDIAVTCSDTGASEFQVLMSNISDRIPANRQYRDSSPRKIAVQVGEEYYYITELYAFDAILI